MGFGGAKQQVPSPWGEKQFKPPTAVGCPLTAVGYPSAAVGHSSNEVCHKQTQVWSVQD